MVVQRKYPSWGKFLKLKRSDTFRSAREFCSTLDVGISYPQYSRYEAGEQLPNLDQAVKICHLLKIPVLEGILEWARAQMTDATGIQEVDSFIERLKTASIDKDVIKATPKPVVPLDDVIVFNRSHLKLFESDNFYRDVFTYINSFAPEWISVDEVAAALEIPTARAHEMVNKLAELGVINIQGFKCRASKSMFYFPDDADFFKLRNQNVSRNASSVLTKMTFRDIKEKKAYRSVVSRELTSDQVELVITGIESLMHSITKLPETAQPESIYSMCVVFGERFSRAKALQKIHPGMGMGLTQVARDVSSDSANSAVADVDQ